MGGLTGDSGISGISGLFGANYADKIMGYGPIAYWPLWEPGGATARCLVNQAQNGIYGGVTLANALGPDGINYAPLFDGINGYVNIDTAALQAVVDSTEGTLACWSRVFNAGVWTDGATRHMIDARDAFFTNQLRITKTTFANHVQWVHTGNGTTVQYFPGALTVGTAWHHWAWTWSQAGGDCHAYLDGALAGSAGAAPVTWSATPTVWLIGSQDVPASNPWYGWIAHVAFWNTPLAQPAIADLAST